MFSVIIIGKSKAKNSVFYPNRNNQDIIGGSISKFKNYKIGNKTISGKYLLVLSKSRLFIKINVLCISQYICICI